MMLNGKISITRPSRSDDRRTIAIEVTDDSSRVQFIEIEMHPADFAEAITGLGFIPCRFGLRRVDLVGTVLEHKSVFVPRDGREAALAEIEVDGWKVRRDDLKNHHRFTTNDGIAGHQAHCERHVAKSA